MLKRLAILTTGIIIGTALGIAVTISVYSIPKEQEALREKRLQSIADQSKALAENLKIKVAASERETATLQKELSEKETALGNAQRELANAIDSVAKLESEMAVLQKSLGDAAGIPAQEKPTAAPHTAEELSQDEFAKQMHEAMKKYANTIVVGSKVPKSAIEELSLSENQVSAINDALKDEEKRLKQIVADFYRDNVEGGAQEDLSALDISQIVMKCLPKMIPELQKLGQLSREEQLQLMKGERSAIDYLTKDSFTGRLAYQLYSGRQQTYEELSLYLEPEKQKRFTEKYIAPNAFVFSGGIHLNFGEIDWEAK